VPGRQAHSRCNSTIVGIGTSLALAARRGSKVRVRTSSQASVESGIRCRRSEIDDLRQFAPEGSDSAGDALEAELARKQLVRLDGDVGCVHVIDE